MFWQSLQATFEIFCSDVAQFGSCFYRIKRALYIDIWIYMDGINRTKGPIVMFMGHIGVPTKEARQR